MFASSAVCPHLVGILSLSFFSPLLCHLWCVLNESNHRNSTVASTSLLRLPLSLSCPLSSYPPSIHLVISVLAVAWWKLHVQTAVMDCIMCSAGRRMYAQQLCVRGCCVHKCGKKTVSGRLTGWLLESFGRVDDHMEKAVEARSLLIWKTSKQSS